MKGSEIGRGVSQHAEPGLRRFEEVLQLLSAQLLRLSWGSARENHLAFASCIPLLSELDRLGRSVPSLPHEAIRTLTRKASWHMRAVAGLANAPTADDEDHASSVREALEELTRLAGLPEKPSQGTATL